MARNGVAGRARPRALSAHGGAVTVGPHEPFLLELHDDGDLDDQTKWSVTELAREEDFLLAVADYLRDSHHRY